MKESIGISLVITLLAVTLGLSATAGAAPSGPSSADSTVRQLQSQGFEVVVNRTGDAASEHCTVDGVRPGQTFSRTDSGAPGAGSSLVTTVWDKTVYVSLTC